MIVAKAGLALALLGAAVLSGTALGLGAGRPPRPMNPGVAAIRQEMARERGETSASGKDLFATHGCLQCHGKDGAGTDTGPGLGVVMPEYLADAGGDEAAAKARLVDYLRRPKEVPTLRRDSTRYPNPMPSAKGLGLDDDVLLDRLAEFLIHMKPPSVAVGGDASGR